MHNLTHRTLHPASDHDGGVIYILMYLMFLNIRCFKPLFPKYNSNYKVRLFLFVEILELK